MSNELKALKVEDIITFGIGGSRLPFKIVEIPYDEYGQLTLSELEKHWDDYKKLIISVKRNGKEVW